MQKVLTHKAQKFYHCSLHIRYISIKQTVSHLKRPRSYSLPLKP